jgi:hypothetical protein
MIGTSSIQRTRSEGSIKRASARRSWSMVRAARIARI